MLKNYQLCIVDNLGDNINTNFDEIAPVPSPSNEDKIYFSSNSTTAHLKLDINTMLNSQQLQLRYLVLGSEFGLKYTDLGIFRRGYPQKG